MKKIISKRKPSTKKSVAVARKVGGKRLATKSKKSKSIVQKVKKVIGDVVTGALSGAASGAMDATAKAVGLPKSKQSEDKEMTKVPAK